MISGELFRAFFPREGVCGAAIIVWLTMPAAPGPVGPTPAAPVTATPALAASTEAAPLSLIQEKALTPKDTFKE